MIQQILIVIFLLTLPPNGEPCKPRPSSPPPSPPPPPPRWIVLGEADQKRYEIRINHLMNREEGRKLCESRRMSLASVQTDKQWELIEEGFIRHNLVEAPSLIFFDSGNKSRYWTAAQGLPDRTSFDMIWTDTGEAVDRLASSRYGISREVYGALLVRGFRATFDLREGTDQIPGVICQAILS